MRNARVSGRGLVCLFGSPATGKARPWRRIFATRGSQLADCLIAPLFPPGAGWGVCCWLETKTPATGMSRGLRKQTEGAHWEWACSSPRGAHAARDPVAPSGEGERRARPLSPFDSSAPWIAIRHPARRGLAPAWFTMQYMPTAPHLQGRHFLFAHRCPKDFLQQQ